jgi:hypothetical protein
MVERDGRQYVAVREAAKRLKRAPGTVREWARGGLIDAVHVITESGHQRLYIASDATVPVTDRA